MDSEGALVFDVIVHQEPEGTTTVAAHCVYPCAGVVPVTDLLRKFVPGRRTTVKIPLSCLVSAGLTPDKVDTPFLVRSEQRFDATPCD